MKTPRLFAMIKDFKVSPSENGEVRSKIITEFALPMSLRTANSEANYQQAKIFGSLKPLWDEEVLHSFKHWCIIANRFPYDSCYKTSHMLLPKSRASEYADLTRAEKTELREIIATYCQDNYHQVIENMTVRRSVMAIYHLHLVTFVDSRGEFTL